MIYNGEVEQFDGCVGSRKLAVGEGGHVEYMNC